MSKVTVLGMTQQTFIEAIKQGYALDNITGIVQLYI
ncbi:MAG: hypothetical protein RLZZ574_694 [Cyanobacteriota bacterium]|jgi:hypothetical protein